MQSRRLALALAALVAAAPALAAVTSVEPHALRKIMGLRLGAWHTDFTVTEIQVEPTPGGDAAAVARAEADLRGKVGVPRTSDECLWDSPEQMFIPGIRVGSGCDFSRVEARDGRFAVTMLCEQPSAGSRVESSFQGAYAPESIDGHFDITVTTGQLRIRMKADGKSRYAGACPPIVSIPR
jgi:hypothetical protein